MDALLAVGNMVAMLSIIGLVIYWEILRNKWEDENVEYNQLKYRHLELEQRLAATETQVNVLMQEKVRAEKAEDELRKTMRKLRKQLQETEDPATVAAWLSSELKEQL